MKAAETAAARLKHRRRSAAAAVAALGHVDTCNATKVEVRPCTSLLYSQQGFSLTPSSTTSQHPPARSSSRRLLPQAQAKPLWKAPAQVKGQQERRYS